MARSWNTILSTLAACAVLCAVAPLAQADPDDRLPARWREGGGPVARKVDFVLARCPERGVWTAEVLSPKKREPHQLELRATGQGFQLLVRAREQDTVGAAGAVAGRVAPDSWRWGPPRVVSLARTGDQLEGEGFKITAPARPVDVAPVATTSRPDPGALGGPEDLPVVRVLITGFDRFPTLRNHPNNVNWDGTISDRVAPTNPSGWVVRNFDLARVDPALRRRARIELHRLVDVPVEYVRGAALVTRTISEVQADVCISMGVGSDGNVDADVETTCRNRMSDGSSFGSDLGEGPFQLPPSWPPQRDRQDWSEQDRLWSSRYPDNAGVSMNGKAIEEGGPDSRRSSLPVAQIVERVKRAGLEAHDGQGGPGTYICNNVMYEVTRVQAQRGELGGFIHLAQWNESKRDDYVKVVAAAIEASVEAALAPPRP